MLTHRGFSAWILSGEQTLQEYLIAVDAKAHRVSCWIPGEEGKNFTVYWRDHGGKVDTCSFITLDGFVVPGRFLFGAGVAWRQGVRTGNTTERPFVFSKVEDTGNDNAIETPSKDVGTIVLRIKRVERTGSRAANSIQKIPDPRVGNRRPGDICVGFGEEKQAYTQHSSTWAVKAYHKDKPGIGKPSTYVTFVFRYRPRAFLQAQGIMPEMDKLPRLPIRQIASAPATPMEVTPHSTPSPRLRERILRFDSSRSSSNAAKRPRRDADPYNPVISRSARLPGEGLLRFDSVPPEDRACKKDEGDPVRMVKDEN